MTLTSAAFGSVLIPLLWIAPLRNAMSEVRTCGKDAADVMVQSDFMHPVATPILRPELPHGIDPRQLPQTVVLYIYVDRTGTVADVCAFSRKTEAVSPTTEALRIAAASAVSTWKYPHDFGITGRINPKVRYLRGTVSFVFTGKQAVTPHESSDRLVTTDRSHVP